MKRILSILVLSVIIVQTLLVPVVATDNQQTITDEEAWNLVESAFNLNVFVNGLIHLPNYLSNDWYDITKEFNENLLYRWIDDYEVIDIDENNLRSEDRPSGCKWIVFGDKTRQNLSNEAHRIYTDDFAEMSWKCDAYDNTVPSIFAVKKENLTSDYVDYIKKRLHDIYWLGNPFSLLEKTSDSSEDPYYCLRDHLLTFSENGNGQASAEVILERDGAPLYENDPDEGFELSIVPVTVNVMFTKTADGWRISGGEFVNAMCNAKAARYSKITRSNYYHFDAGQIIVNKLIANHFSDNRSDVWADDMKATYLSDKYVKYIMSIDCTAPNGEVVKGTYSAYYKYVSKDQYLAEYATEEDKKYEDDWSSDDMFMVLYGGGLYDLLVNGNLDAEQFHGEKSAYTGDGDNVKQIIIFASAAIAAACACLCVIRKRKKTE